MCIIPIFWRFKDKSFTVVSSIKMKEDSYSEPAIRRVALNTQNHWKLDCFTEPHLFFAFMHKSFATMPRFYAQVICKIATMVLYFGCSKEPLIEMVLHVHMFKLKKFKAHIPISFLRFQRYKLYSGTTRFLEFV